MKSTRRSGQAFLETLVALPFVIAMITLAFATIFAIGARYLVQDRLDETLLCFTVQPRRTCEAAWDRLVKETALAKLNVQASFQQNGELWTARTRMQLPWGQKLSWRRELKTHLTENP